MPNTWIRALNEYNYPVNLACYRHADDFPSFFHQKIRGDRNSTMLFEDYFRENIQNIEVWYEVVFWKMYSQIGRRDLRTTRIIEKLSSSPVITAPQLIAATKSFINNPIRSNFIQLRNLFRFGSESIAIVATFPAFLDAVKFPMVDTRIAKWVNSQLDAYNKKNPSGPQLVRSRYGQNTSTVLTMSDFDFYNHWIDWTRYISIKLSKLTDMNWRARDVEMAVFTAWGDKKGRHPRLPLHTI